MLVHRISVDIDEEDHRYLKMCCAKMGTSLKKFVLKCVLDQIDAQEDKWWLESEDTKNIFKKLEEGKLQTVPFEDALNELGINV